MEPIIYPDMLIARATNSVRPAHVCSNCKHYMRDYRAGGHIGDCAIIAFRFTPTIEGEEPTPTYCIIDTCDTNTCNLWERK